MRAVGSHIRYKAQYPHRAQLNALIKLLSHPHGPFGGETEPIGGGLLKRRGDKRRRRTRNSPLDLQIGNAEFAFLQRRQDIFGCWPVEIADPFVIDRVQIRLEGAVLLEPLILLGDGRALVLALGGFDKL